MYSHNGGTLTVYPIFGNYPLKDHPYEIFLRERIFFHKFQSFDALFSNVVSGDGAMFQQAVMEFIEITETLDQYK